MLFATLADFLGIFWRMLESFFRNWQKIRTQNIYQNIQKISKVQG